MTVLPLQNYDMSEDTGFLCRYDTGDITLTGNIKKAADIALNLPNILPSGNVRSYLVKNLPNINIDHDINGLSNAELRMATIHYSFMVQSYIWGEKEPPEMLPSCLAIPMVALSDSIGQPPILTYSGYVLDNWSRIDKTKPIDLDNIHMIQNFLGGQDEAWFVLVHVAIEAHAGQILSAMGPIIEAANKDEPERLRELLTSTATRWAGINAIFDRMPEKCDPYIYFERVRPYIHGWKDNPALPDGIIYEGVERYSNKAQAFRGQTGSQSSIVPSMDALLCVGHATDPLREFLDQLHRYRSPKHRQFIEDVRTASNLRHYVSNSKDTGLINAYNTNIQAVADFRSRHLEYAASYINKQQKQADGNDTDVGTGGTPFMRYLKKHRDETQANLLAA